MKTDEQKFPWKRVLEIIAYICTALAGFIGGSTLM